MVRKREILVFILFCCIGFSFSQTATLSGNDPLKQCFILPQEEYRPHTFWYWMNGNISKEGIDADLDAMQRVGIGGVNIFNISGFYAPAGKVQLLSPEWLNLMKYAIIKAGKLGLSVNLNNSMRGWSSSGGPWISPEKSMKKLTWSETRIHGNIELNITLPQPECVLNYYEDVAVLAFPTPKSEMIARSRPIITTSDSLADASVLLDGNRATKIILSPAPQGKKQFIQLEYKEPFAARSLQMISTQEYSGALPNGQVQVSADGKSQDFLTAFDSGGSYSNELTFPATRSKFWRIEFEKNSPLLLSEFILSPTSRIPHWGGKALMGWVGLNRPSFSDSELPVDTLSLVKSGEVIDLTSKMTDDGQLRWTPPSGDWTIVRIGHTSTGMAGLNAALSEDLECDKFDTTALNIHWENSIMPYINDKKVNPHFQAVHIDSYEKGSQNWTSRFPEDFKNRAGYDIIRFLPILTGRIIDDLNTSERFLADFRQVCDDLFYENYYRHFRDLCARYNKTFTAEAYGEAQFNATRLSTVPDVPMSEFWVRNPLDYKNYPSIFKRASSAAHTHGRKINAAEAFTSNTKTTGNYCGDPWALKAIGDIAFCGGVNQFAYHVFTMQPWMNYRPGTALLIHGTHFERTNTWFEKMPAYNQYVSRCQAMLQQGLFVGDVLYFTGEATPNDHFKPTGATSLPPGYDGDYCDFQTLLDRVTVRDGKLTFPDGLSYRILVLPNVSEMSIQLLKRIAQLLRDGAVIIGPKPERTLSLNPAEGYFTEFQKLTHTIWGLCDGVVVTENSIGKGKIYWGKTLKEVLNLHSISEDFKGSYLPNSMRYIHRRLPERDLYFVANSADSYQSVDCTFRTDAGSVELWDPVSGNIRPLNQWVVNPNGTISVTLQFEPRQSWFVVFNHTQPTPTTPNSPDFPVTKAVSVVKGSWDVYFNPAVGGPGKVRFNALTDWTKRFEEGIKYYSGTAIYKKKIILKKHWLNEKLFLDLGNVKNIADVRLNGKALGTVWCAPWRVEISKFAKAGYNNLEIEVVNLWPNRMIGDERQFPDDCDYIQTRADGMTLTKIPDWLMNGQPRPTGRHTFTTFKMWTKDDNLLPSGLIGPLTIMVEK